MDKPKDIDFDKLEEDPYTYSESLTIKQLTKLLRYLSYMYYNTSKSIIDDDIYDSLRELLEKVDPKNKFLKEIGAPVKNEKKKVNLPYPMNSLDKIKADTDALKNWTKKYSGPFILSDKLDGNSAMLYKNTQKFGEEVKLYSRGKKGVGRDNTHLVNYIISKKIFQNLPDKVAIRGELIISKKNFKKIVKYLLKKKQITKEDLKKINARNTLAGVINAKTINSIRKKILKYVEYLPYWILYPKMKPSKQLKQLKKWNFKLPYHTELSELSNEKISNVLEKRSKESDYMIDGIVVINDDEHDMPLDKNPKFAFAYKSILTEDKAESTVLKVKWKESKDGYFKPKIIITPFYTEGVKITRATVHNAKFVVDNVIGPGAKVLMTRSNNVIPKVIKVLKPASNGKPQMPKKKYKWNDTEVDIISTDPKSKKKIDIAKLTYFFKKMQIRDISESRLKKLYENGFTTIKKILKAKPKDFAVIEGLGNKSATKICENIKTQLNSTTPEKFMAASQAFGRNFGEERISLVLKEYPDIIFMSKNLSKKKLVKKILKIKGFAEITAEAFIEGIPKFKSFIREIKKYFDYKKLIKTKKKTQNKKKNKEQSDNPISGKTVVFSGFRDESLKKWIQDNGGSVTTTVSGNTDILIVSKKSLENPTSKIKKAEESGKIVVSLEVFKNEYDVN